MRTSHHTYAPRKRRLRTASQVAALAILLATFCACSNRPDYVMPPRKMKSVLIDMHLAQGTMQAAGLTQRTHSEECNAYYQAVLAQHGITQAIFDSSIVYYTAHPNQFENIYAKVQDELEQRVKEMEATGAADGTPEWKLARPTVVNLSDSINAQPRFAPDAQWAVQVWQVATGHHKEPAPPIVTTYYTKPARSK